MTTIFLSVLGTCVAFIACAVAASTDVVNRTPCIMCNWAVGLWIGMVAVALFAGAWWSTV